MTDTNEFEALKASLRGALETARALELVQAKVDALRPQDAIDEPQMEELARASLAHAVASQALRGLVESMRARRESSGGT